MNELKLFCQMGMACGVVLGASSLAQAQIKPDSIDRSTIRPGARALGLGGSYLIAVDDASAAVWNPAAISGARRITVPLGVAARTDNVNVDNIVSLARGIGDLADAVDDGTGGGTVGSVRGAFDDVFRFARDAGARDGGAPARLNASVVPLFGASFQNYGITIHSGIFADLRLGTVGTQTGNRTINADAAGLALSTVSVPYARSFKTKKGVNIGTFGVSAKWMRADYAATTFVASEGVNPQTGVIGDISGTTYDRSDDTAFDIDLGYISPAFPQFYGAKAAVAVRHLLSPEFRFRSETKFNGNTVAPTNLSVRQRPQIDVGVAVPNAVPKTLFAAELHNLSGANGGDLSFHLGAEYALNNQFAFRAGLDDDAVVGGVGIKFGPTRLDVAVGTQFQERFAVGLTSMF